MCVHGGWLTKQSRLDEVPTPEQRINLPASFGTRFAIFGDAEEEFDWNGPFRRDSTSTSTIRALPEANIRFASAGICPVWLADWPVVDNPESGIILRDLVASGACTVGTQLHPWVNPPFDEDINTRNSYTGNLPLELQAAKLTALTRKIEEATGMRPRIYRAGRYGIGKHTADLLAGLDYRLDVSVRSGFDYRAQGGPDFSRHPTWPWQLGEQLYALPLTTAYIGSLNRWPGLYRAEPLRGSLARTGLLARVPLTPEGVPLADALKAIDTLLAEQHRLFSLSFHTPSLVPGYSPYVRDAADLAEFWAWWDGVFNHFAKKGVEPAGSEAIMAAFAAAA